MSTFSAEERSFLQEGPKLARLATVDAAGDPHVVPTGWTYNSAHDTIDVGGKALERTQKYRNVSRSGRAAIVIDDVLPPWRPRAVLVKGPADALESLIRIHPEHVVSWGIHSTRIGERASRRVSAPDRVAQARELRFALVCDDYDAALRLFRDLFGLRTLKVLDAQGGRGVILHVPAATLELLDREYAALVDHVEVGQALDDRARIAVNIDELAQAAAELRSTGAVPMAEPVDTPWRDRNQRFRTADGLQLTLFQSAI
jgi:pyridoxamine 5'-phosphate oxidase family protein